MSDGEDTKRKSKSNDTIYRDDDDLISTQKEICHRRKANDDCITGER